VQDVFQFLIWLAVGYWFFGRKVSAIGYSGFLWVIATTFGSIIALVLATALPDRRYAARRLEETALIDRQLIQASLPVRPGEALVPRRTISDDPTQGGES
jgi:hypothetical protein